MVLPLSILSFMVDRGPASASEPLLFNRDIRPILSENCFLCHGPDEDSRAAGLRLDLPESAYAERDGVGAVVPGEPEKSELIRRIETDDPDDRMPPPESERSLSPEARQKLRDWVAQGAAYQRHWAFEPIMKPKVPEIRDPGMARNPIDRFVGARLEKENLVFSEEVVPEKLARRVFFDLTGLPPTLEDLDTFLEDSVEGRLERLVDRLLQSDAYGERMASEWLDVARYSDTYGYQVDRDRFVWPWRDWVVEAFNKNLPYDDFITWQVSGDLLPNPTREQILATAFNRLHPQKVEGGSVPEEFRIEYVADRTQTFGTAFLGLTLECARCHDHKYDPLKQKEYYQLTSFFANIDEAGLYSYFTDSIPTPTMVIGPADKEGELTQRRSELRNAEAAYRDAKEKAEVAFDRWLEANAAVEFVEPVGYFDFESFEGGKLVNHAKAETPATSSSSNVLVAGKKGQAIRLSGDDQVDLKIGNFTRYQPFSISLWVSTPRAFERSVIFHRSRAWTDAASRGYQMLLEDGRPSFSLIHFWPGNSIRVKAREPLPVNQFVHLAVTYDGSARAKGIRLFLDGKEAAMEIVRDRLTKNMTGGGGDHIGIGARFRDVGFKEGVVDEFRVYDVQLSALEVRDLFQEGALATALDRRGQSLTDEERTGLREFYALRVSEGLAERRGGLQESRRKVADLENGLTEMMVMRENAPRTSYLLHRGAYDARREPVALKTPDSLPAFEDSFPENRLGLSDWLTSPNHPLTARVTVNRYWQMIFGRGLVRTSEDFGSQGEPPSHPQLLDWLAADFIEHGWDVKRLLKLMVCSHTYRQSSRVSETLVAVDPENRLLARAPRYRLPAEMIRDNALAVSGLLVSKLGGPPVKPYEVAVSFKPAKVDKGDGLYRRSLYTYWKRTGPAPVMMALDASKRDVCSVKRETTATPLQAFVFMNDPQFVESARQLAIRIKERFGHLGLGDQLARLFRMLTSRWPNKAEGEILESLYQDQLAYFRASPDSMTAFLEVGEAKSEDEYLTPELAAYTVVASGLLSHDECLMKR